MHCLISSVVCLGRALFSRTLLFLQGHPGVSSWLPREVLTKFDWGLGHELFPPGAVVRQGSPLGEGSREVEVGQVASKRPSEGNFLAVGDAGLAGT